MPEIERISDRYPVLKSIKGYCRFHGKHVQLDGHFTTCELHILAETIEQIDIDFRAWYKKCCEIEPNLSEDPVNAFYHNFIDGLTSIEAIERSAKYGLKKEKDAFDKLLETI